MMPSKKCIYGVNEIFSISQITTWEKIYYYYINNTIMNKNITLNDYILDKKIISRIATKKYF